MIASPGRLSVDCYCHCRCASYQAFKKPLASRSTTRHYVPDLVFKLAKLQTLLNFLWRHCCTQPISSSPFDPGCSQFSPPCMSCLFANTNNSASFISRSNMILCSSCLASSILDRSFESMTKMRPCVPVDVVPSQPKHLPANIPTTCIDPAIPEK